MLQLIGFPFCSHRLIRKNTVRKKPNYKKRKLFRLSPKNTVTEMTINYHKWYVDVCEGGFIGEHYGDDLSC